VVEGSTDFAVRWMFAGEVMGRFGKDRDHRQTSEQPFAGDTLAASREEGRRAFVSGNVFFSKLVTSRVPAQTPFLAVGLRYHYVRQHMRNNVDTG